ncbi:MAG: hypothetical protein IJL32_10840 [Oscillospiraceae bacterium]|nr:hypothetical protein [Oscillospiraceae bacterium]
MKIEKLRKGSKRIAGICIPAILFNFACIGRMTVHLRAAADPDPVMKYVLFRKFLNEIL